MTDTRSLADEIRTELDTFLTKQESRFDQNETLTIDLHCHDYNSDVPDELLGRILGVPETWLATERLLEILTERGITAPTITNHNNARSCFALLDKGIDVLVGAEFSCMIPDYATGIHVLTYGFLPEHEKPLNKLRSDIYKFLDYTTEHNFPTVLAHPLYYYETNGVPRLDILDTLALLFERFEVINGQRDTWQNMLTKVWVESLTPEKIDLLAHKTGIKADRYSSTPYIKRMTGGSDEHMGIFAGLTGTRLHVPELEKKLLDHKKSELALEALRHSELAPFGSHNDSEKMTAAFLDYFCQITLNMQDPGLMRLLLHKGTFRDKLIAFAAANGFAELKRHKLTTTFIKIFHGCFTGRIPDVRMRIFTSKPYRNLLEQVTTIARVEKNQPERAAETFKEIIPEMYTELNKILFSRLGSKLEMLFQNSRFSGMNLHDVIDSFEIPSHLRDLFSSKPVSGGGIRNINMAKLFDGLSFPFLAAGVILAASFTSKKVMYNSRPLLEEFSREYGRFKHPKRMLWMTDTFEENNGVALVLHSVLDEIRARNLPIDILVLSKTLKSEDHLIVFPPVFEFTVPFYKDQSIRIPDVLALQRFFKEREYDRVLASTEGFMGMMALYLKHAFTVPAYFYVHTDWMQFAKRVLNFDKPSLSRLKRLLRVFYKGFDGVFVLNNNQSKWFKSSAMNFNPDNVFLTAHWTDKEFYPRAVQKQNVFRQVKNDDIVLLFAGRISEEKGVMELPLLFKKIQMQFPNVKMVFAGTGPAEEKLKAALPDAEFLGWVNHSKLPDIYSASDILLMPSRFDTFGCVVLESLSCGLPVISYNSKGPKDIICNGINGFVVKSRDEFTAAAIQYLTNRTLQKQFKIEAVKRAKDYTSDQILKKFLEQLDLVQK